MRLTFLGPGRGSAPSVTETSVVSASEGRHRIMPVDLSLTLTRIIINFESPIAASPTPETRCLGVLWYTMQPPLTCQMIIREAGILRHPDKTMERD